MIASISSLPKVLLLALLLVGTANSYAEDVSVMEFKRDLRTLYKEVLDPLAERFARDGEAYTWRDYIKAMLDDTSKLRYQLNPMTYGVLRDITLTLAQDFTEFHNQGDWRNAAYYLNTKLDLIERVMGYMELDQN